MKELKRQLRSMTKDAIWNPDRLWVEKNRERLFFVMKEQSAQKAVVPEKISFIEKLATGVHIFLPHTMVSAVRPLASLAAVALIAIGGWIASVSASYNSIPGDVLYNVKLAAEKTQEMVVTVTGSGEEKTQMHLEFAERRAKEVKQVVANKEPEHATAAIASLKKSITAVADTMKDAQKDSKQELSDVEKTLALAKNVNDKSGEITNTLNQVLLDTAKNGNTALSKEVVDATKAVNETGMAAVQVAVETVVQQQSQGTLAPAPEKEVKAMVAEKIATIAHEQEVTGNAVAEVKISSPAVTTTTTVSSTIPIVVSTTQQLVIADAVQKAAESTVVARDAITEAKSLVENNQLLQAMEKVKEANNATQEVKQVVVNAQQAVKEQTAVPNATLSVPTIVTTTTTTSSTIPITTTTLLKEIIKK